MPSDIGAFALVSKPAGALRTGLFRLQFDSGALVYGHGLAADVNSIKGKDRSERLDASRLLWSWIDQHAKTFGLGRPYLDYDPPHVAPIDGKEYAHHRRAGEPGRRVAGIRKRNRIAVRDRG